MADSRKAPQPHQLLLGGQGQTDTQGGQVGHINYHDHNDQRNCTLENMRQEIYARIGVTGLVLALNTSGNRRQLCV